ncbi:hypothetical protein [Paraliomyxa miuraensis]|nr:hypothetical protein [Paraliomyxa miuraensis]MCX4246160.1 hypothetical protein [Paraliomyxa miuraensis]
MHAWLVRLTQPEDPILWTWVAIAALHAVVGILMGIRAQRPSTSRPD